MPSRRSSIAIARGDRFRHSHAAHRRTSRVTSGTTFTYGWTDDNTRWRWLHAGLSRSFASTVSCLSPRAGPSRHLLRS